MGMNMSGGAKGQAMDTDMDFEYLLEVLQDKDSLRIIKTVFNDIKMKMDMGMLKVNLDTRQPQKDTTFDMQTNPGGIFSVLFYALKGKTFQMYVNSKGEVVKIDGLQQVKDAMVQAFSANENMRAMAEQMLSSQLSEANMRKSFAQAFNIFPNKPVSVGDSWSHKMEMDGLVQSETATTYKVASIKDDEVVLDVSSDIDAGGNKAKQTGKMKVDPASGLVKDARLQTKFGGAVDMTMRISIIASEQKG